MTWKEQAEKHAEECIPKESCGLLAIIKGEKIYWPCKNIAESGFEYFVIDPDDWAECEDTGEIIGVVHSHPNDPAIPSDNDKASCDYLGFEWFIYSAFTKEWCSFKPSDFKSGLYGRTWIWGKQDCLSLIWDYFEEKLNLKLKDWPRPRDLKAFAQKPYFQKVLTESGFRKVDINNIQPNDILVMEGIFNKLNHVALYLGDQTILHHTLKKLSCRETYDLEYIKLTKEVYRYEA